MRNKIFLILFTAGFLLLCLTVGISVFFSQGDAAIEKQEIAEFPKLFDENGGFNTDFDSELSAYVSQRVAFRGALLNLNSRLRAAIFNTSSEAQVIKGKDGWLFFAETLDDYSAAGALSERGIFNLADTIQQMDEYCKSKSAGFVFFAAPNKNTVYPDFMPSRYLRNTENNLQRLIKALEGSGIGYVDLKTVISSSETPLYYKTDTHWNDAGALMVHNAVLDALAKEHETYADTPHVNSEWKGDLEEMLHPGEGKSEESISFDITQSYNYAKRLKSPEDIIIQTSKEGAEGSLLMLRDSFANNMLQFFSEQYGSAYYSRAVPYDFTLIETQTADDVIFEIAERRLTDMINRAPLIPSKGAAVQLTDSPQAAEIDLRFAGGDYSHFYGTIDLTELEISSKIYLVFTDESGESTAFRCFNAYEATLLNEKDYKDNGFSVYIDSENIADGNFEISLLIDTDGVQKLLESGKIFADNTLSD